MHQVAKAFLSLNVFNRRGALYLARLCSSFFFVILVDPFAFEWLKNVDSFVGAGALLIVANIIFISSVDKHAISVPWFPFRRQYKAKKKHNR